MKRLNKILFGCSAIAAVMASGCTKNFDKYNSDPYALTPQGYQYDYNYLGGPLEEAQLNIMSMTNWNYQTQQNLNADVYSGYFMSADPFNSNVNNLNYFLTDAWNAQAWDDAYNSVMGPTQSVLDTTNNADGAIFYSWAKIIRVEAMHRVSDIYGPIIYSKYGTINPDGSTSYDSQQQAYTEFFNDLDSAIDVFTQNVGQTSRITKFDYVYGGDYSKWLKFANTLRLRLAIRISNINPTLAKTEGEKSLSNAGGLLSTSDDNAYVEGVGVTENPINSIRTAYGDIDLGAPLLCYLNGYKDARLPKIAQPASDPAVSGQYIGIRNGVRIDDIGRYASYSLNADLPNKMLIMTAAEAWFLKAEAALLGWSGAGNAGTDYNMGVQTSFAQYSLDATAYLNDDSSTEQEYIDPKAINAGENDIKKGSPWLSTITIKWDDGATDAQKLERIITQKWLAMYPDGEEAWAEFRRTGYPKLFPVVINNSNGTISTTKFIQRLNFPADERSTNAAGVAAAVQLLGGADNGGTPLWWAPH